MGAPKSCALNCTCTFGEDNNSHQTNLPPVICHLLERSVDCRVVQLKVLAAIIPQITHFAHRIAGWLRQKVLGRGYQPFGILGFFMYLKICIVEIHEIGL